MTNADLESLKLNGSPGKENDGSKVVQTLEQKASSMKVRW
jgi:hypothetical protein